VSNDLDILNCDIPVVLDNMMLQGSTVETQLIMWYSIYC